MDAEKAIGIGIKILEFCINYGGKLKNVLNRFKKKKKDQGVIEVTLTSEEPVQKDGGNSNLVLKNVVSSDHVEDFDWKKAKKRISSYNKDIAFKKGLHTIIISSHRVNLCALMMMGYYFDYRSGINIIYRGKYGENEVLYKMSDCMINREESRSISFVKDHDEFDKQKKYIGAAIYICFNRKGVNEDKNPFEKYILNNYREKDIYCMRYFSDEDLTENHRFEEAAGKIEEEVRKRLKEIGMKTDAPYIHMFLNVAAPMAVSIGRQFANFGNIQLYGYINKEMSYYPAVLLDNKNSA